MGAMAACSSPPLAAVPPERRMCCCSTIRRPMPRWFSPTSLWRPAAPTPPTLPPPSGRPFLATHSQLAATRDGSTIVGVNVPGTGSPTVFVYETASNTVLRARIVAGSSTVLSVSDDGSRFICGPNLFDTATLQVLAQRIGQRTLPDPSANTSFNMQSNQGGGVFSPDGQTLYSAFDISPVQNPPASCQCQPIDAERSGQSAHPHGASIARKSGGQDGDQLGRIEHICLVGFRLHDLAGRNHFPKPAGRARPIP